MRDLLNKLDSKITVAETSKTAPEVSMPYGNPYKGADAEKFAQMTPADQEWLTRPVSDDKGGMRPAAPDISGDASTNPILYRAPNKGRLVSKPTPTPTPIVKPVDNTPKPPTQNDDLAKLNALISRLEKTLKEGSKFNFANNLIESFGYQLDETTNINPDAAGFLQTKLNVAAPQANTFDPNQKYRDALAKQDADKAAKAYSDAEASELRKQAAAKAAPATAVGKEAEIAAGLQKAGVPVAKNAEQAAAQVASKVGAKAGGKMLSKLIPGVGLVVGTMDAISRAKEGDWKGAAMAGLSAVLSLGGPLTAAASMGLDAANIARDYKAGKFGSGSTAAPTGTTGDPKLQQLQKIIGAKPDGLMGPETSSKLKAWQAKQGIAADGMPGPETYGAAGIAESRTTVAEDMQSIQRRLALIESKAVIRESLASKYYLNESYFIQDEYGNIVTDLTTISVINEAAANGDIDIDEGIWSDAIQGLAKYGKDAYQGAKDLVGGAVKGSKSPAAAERLAARASTTGAKKAGLKAGAAVGKNPVKAGLAASAAGAGLGYGLGDGPDTPEPTPGPNPSPVYNIEPMPTPDTDVTEPDTPTGLTDEQKELIKQIRDLEHKHGEDKAPDWISAVSHGDEVIGKAEGGKGSSSLNPAIGANKDTTIPSGAGIASLKESDNELTRWLKIAKG